MLEIRGFYNLHTHKHSRSRFALFRGVFVIRIRHRNWIDECREDVSRYPNPDWYPAVLLKWPERDLIHDIVKPYDWNQIQVIARGKQIEIKVNGITTVNFTEDMNVPAKGSICLQAHSGDPYEVHFKDIRIRKLSEKSSQ